MPCPHWSRDLNLQTPNQFSISQLISPQRHRYLLPGGQSHSGPRTSSLDALSRASPLSHHFLPPQTRNLSIPGRHPSPLTPGPTVAASARPPPQPPQAAPLPPEDAGQGPLGSFAAAPAVGRAVARPRRAGTVPAEAAPPPPGGRGGAGAGRFAGPTSAQPGRGLLQNGGRVRRGRGRACDRARAAHLDAEARASLSPQRWLRRRRALLTRCSPPPTGC